MFQFLDFDETQLIKIALCLGFGLVFGLPRQLKGRYLGISTSTMIALSSMFVVSTGYELHPEQIDRLIGQVTLGVGFIGGGLVLVRKGVATGVHAAASVWLLSAVGAAVGVEKYVTATVTLLVAVIVTSGMQALQNRVPALNRGVHGVDESIRESEPPTGLLGRGADPEGNR